MSSTTYSVRDLCDASATNGMRQYTSAFMLVYLRVVGSISVIWLDTLVHTTSGPRPPSDADSLAGRHTRSSLQMGAISMEKVYLKLYVLECVSCDTSCLSLRKRMGTTDCRKSTRRSACARDPKKKSRPSWMSVILTACSAAPCLRMSCSRKKNVRLWNTCCRTCAHAIHELGLALARLQSGHMLRSTMKSTTNACCRMAPLNTSAWMVSLTLSLMEWGSVQMKPASTSLTLFRPLIFLMQKVSSSLLSSSARIQCLGGCR
mmetsp:Transcript_23258/g.59410  ORF Transcript_23258/g.59410 Transcript_23258/m.59410 type:complete len:261 (+) Transcript_23258:1426-2208(+)